LARRVHDSSPFQEKFDKIVASIPDLVSSKTTLDRRVPTRWNSDFTCLRAHVQFRTAVRMLTTDSELSAYALSEEQWKLAQQLIDILIVTPNLVSAIAPTYNLTP
jgi:hypothetical protein